MKSACSRFVVTVFLCSCSIIDDSDITTLEQFNKLSVSSIDIIQVTATKTLTSTIEITLDTSVTIATPNGTVTRYVEMALNNFISTKLKFASGTTSNKLVFTENFLSDGRPFTFSIRKDTTVLELYRFRYNDQKKINRINFFLGPERLVYSDSIIYNGSGKISSIVRKAYEDGSKNGTMTIEYGPGSPATITRTALGNYQFQQITGSCPDGGANYNCNGYMRSNTGGGGSSPQITLKSTGVRQLEEISIEDIRNNGNGGGREPDVYYFHPLVLLKNNFSLGDDLAVIYLIDWWSVGAQSSSTNQPNKDERVTFKFNYEL